MSPPQAGLLSCADCHSDNPQLNNFGNIWAGRNAAGLIQRAVQNNTGGMGYFLNHYGVADLADIAAFLGNTPGRLDFGAAQPGRTTHPQTITVHAGTKTSIDRLAFQIDGDFIRLGGTCTGTVLRQASCSIDVAFRPTQQGVRGGSLFLTHDGTLTPVQIRLSGLGSTQPPTEPVLDRTNVDFASVDAGQQGARRHVRLINGSDGSLRLGAIETSNSQFEVVGGSCVKGIELEQRQGCHVTLRFAPIAAGLHDAALTIAHDGADGRSVVALAGIAGPGPAAWLQIDPGVLDFGVVFPGMGSPAQRLKVHNRGSATAALVALASTDPAFVIEHGDCSPGKLLAPDDACQVQVRFQPGRAAAFTANVRVEVQGQPAAYVALIGRAIAEQPLARLQPASLVMDAAVGSAELRRHGVVNQGHAPLRLGRIAFVGPDANDFSVLETGSCQPGMAVASKTHCSVEVRFAPLTLGTKRARLQVHIEGSSLPIDAELEGRALPTLSAQLWVDAHDLSFGRTTSGAAAADVLRTATVNNRGAAPLTWRALTISGQHRGSFVPSGTCASGTPVLPGKSCTVTVRFAPDRVGDHRADLVLWPSAAEAASLIALHGSSTVHAPPALPTPAPQVSSPFAWASLPDRPAHDLTPVGAWSDPLEWQVRNQGLSPSAPMRINIDGEHHAEFSVDPSGDCTYGRVLAPGAICRLRVRFHPLASGARSARLFLWADGTASDSGPAITLRGPGLAAATAKLQISPREMAFAATVGARSPAQHVWLQNAGAGMLSITTLAVPAAGLARISIGAPDACPSTPFQLSPGQRCRWGFEWDGSAAVVGTHLRIDGEGFSASVPVVISEDPAQQRNDGTGGGGWTRWMLLLWLAVLGLHLVSRSESRHV